MSDAKSYPDIAGSVTVPTEPTKEMAEAGRKALAAVADRMETAKLTAVSVIDFWQQVGHQPANEIYTAMLSVLPGDAAQLSAGSARLTELAQALVALQEDMPSADVRDCLGEAAHYLEKFSVQARHDAQPSPGSGEPVAWQISHDGRWISAHPMQIDRLRREGRELRPLYAGVAKPAPDEDHPDCITNRERELYDALMGLSSAVAARRNEWSNWVQGGVKIAPTVQRALRLDGYSISSTNRCTTCNGRGIIGGFVSADSGYQDEPCPDCSLTSPDRSIP